MTVKMLEITFFKHEGDNIRVFENSNDCIGQVIVQGNNHEECEITLNSILKNIEMKLKQSIYKIMYQIQGV